MAQTDSYNPENSIKNQTTLEKKWDFDRFQIIWENPDEKEMEMKDNFTLGSDLKP